MDTSSEYAFPIFISSTDYNLKDLRAELARFLVELGYKPFLSSAEGFPDSSPTLEPWESCIPVLDKSFVMILIIDGKYGKGLSWPNFKEHFEGKKPSPTHGEYIYAHKHKKRMLVFIRKSLMPHYQSYRTVMEACGEDKAKAKTVLAPTLPEYVTFETLDFINEVKTQKPIPWINEFEDITTIKREVQKKMLNELAELFLIKNRHIETVVDAFNKVLDSLSAEKQKEILQKIHATKEIVETVDKLAVFEKDLSEARAKLEKAESTGSKDKKKYENQIVGLKKKIAELENETLTSTNGQFFIQGGQVKLGNPTFLSSGAPILGVSSLLGTNVPLSTSNTVFYRNCDGCGNISLGNQILATQSEYNTCPSCKRYLCQKCWPTHHGNSAVLSTNPINPTKCPKCVASGN